MVQLITHLSFPGLKGGLQARTSTGSRGGEVKPGSNWLSLNTNVSRAVTALRPAPHSGRGQWEPLCAAHWHCGGLQNEPAALVKTSDCWLCLSICLPLGLSVPGDCLSSIPDGCSFMSLPRSCRMGGRLWESPTKAPQRAARAQAVVAPERLCYQAGLRASLGAGSPALLPAHRIP